MKTKANVLAGFTMLLTLSLCSQAQNFNRTVSTNEVHHNSISDAWNFSVNPGLGFVVNSHATPGADNARMATNFSGRKYFGNVGLGLSGGIMVGNISNDEVSKFLSDRNYPTDVTVTKSNPSNSYLLFGPAVRFGKKVQFGAELSGGLFLNNVGSLIVTPQGAPRPLYSLDNGNKNFYPGFSGNIHIDYPINNSIRFFISGGYVQTKSSNRIIDMQQGIDFPRLQNRDLKLFTAGIGISKTFGGRKGEKSDGLSAGKIKNGGKVNGNINVGNAYRNEQDGSLKGKYRALREPPTETYNPWEIDDDVEGTVINPIFGNDGNNTSSSSSCGPVTIRTTNPDGTVTETTFACPQDAAQFQQRSSSVNSLNNSMPSRLSMTPTTAKQTQGKTFGEKLSTGLNSGRSIHRDSATRNNILFGTISHWPSAAEANGIVTNKSSGIGGMTSKPGGMTSSSYAAGKKGNGNFNGGPGDITLSIQEKGGGKSASNTQYQLVYSDDTNITLENADISVNPLYQSTGNSGENPIFEANNKSISSGIGDLDRDGIPELMVSLIDPANGEVLATTKTEANGDFYFANLPTGTYAVKVEGDITQKKGYEVSIKKKLDIAGKILSTDESWAIELNTATGTVEQAAAYVQKTRTKSNNSNDRLMGNTNDNSGLVWSPRSNFKVLPMAIADVDRDGLEEMAISRGASLLGGALGGGFASKPGGPIKGIIVKGGRNPGGDIVVQGRTNANGEFEFKNLQPGSYNFTIEGTTILDDVTFVIVGDDQNNSLSKTDAQDYNSTRSNKLTVNTNTGNDSTNTPTQKAQNNNTVRSNRTDNALVTNNDNENTKKVIVRGWDPAKKESLQRNINTSKDNLKSLSAELDKMEQQMKRARRDIWGSGGASNKVENLRAAIADVQQTLNTLQQKDKETALNELDQKTSAMNMRFDELQNNLSGLGNEYSSISNVLKTKHDTAKNSIGNVR